MSINEPIGNIENYLTDHDLGCAVCLEPFEEPKKLPCKHTFCAECIRNLVTRKCPLCRTTFRARQIKRNKEAEKKIQDVFRRYAEEQNAIPTVSNNNAPEPSAPPLEEDINDFIQCPAMDAIAANPALSVYRDGSNNRSAQHFPVIASMEDYLRLIEAATRSGTNPMSLAVAADKSIEMMQEPEVFRSIGLDADNAVDGPGAVFAKYQVPLGLMNKLFGLADFDELEFIIDDSAAMNVLSTEVGSDGRALSQWKATQLQLKQLLEILAYFPKPKITLRFLNSKRGFSFNHVGVSPRQFVTKVHETLDQLFAQTPTGSRPVMERISWSFGTGEGKRIARYVFCGGAPHGGQFAINGTRSLINSRSSADNPVTFISCSDNSDRAQWMHAIADQAPHCATYDSFEDERVRVQRNQGKVLPFTRGIHLLRLLVGVLNQDDLDAIKLPQPITKWCFDNFLGIKTSEPEYRYYVSELTNATGSRALQLQWGRFIQELLSNKTVRQTPAIAQYRIERQR